METQTKYEGNLIESLMRITDAVKLDAAKQTLATFNKTNNLPLTGKK